MPQFPRTKNDILVLAAKIAFGITNNPAYYTNPPFDPANLNALLGMLLVQTADHVSKEAAAKAALDLKNGTIDDIMDESKRIIRLAEATHNRSAAKLQEIGWDVRRTAQSFPPASSSTRSAAGSCTAPSGSGICRLTIISSSSATAGCPSCAGPTPAAGIA